MTACVQDLVSGQVMSGTYGSRSSDPEDMMIRARRTTHNEHTITGGKNDAFIWGSSEVLLVARSTTYHYHLSSNLAVGISEGCLIFDLASLPLAVARPI